MRRWLAGWLCRIGGLIVRLGDRIYPPYPERARSLTLTGRDGS